MPARERALDGIRALACLDVVCWHLHLPGAAGGWLGVEVFFVLSGYLITRLLLAETDRTGRIDVRRFYIRRAARLYPALVLTVAGCLALAALTSLPGAAVATNLDVTVADALLALTYTTDVVTGAGGWTGSLTPTWSLAVEEQFYLLWPLAVGALAARRRALAAVCTAGVALSLAAAVGAPFALAYFSPVGQVFPLLSGAVLALLPAARRPSTTVARMLAAVAAVLLVEAHWLGQKAPFGSMPTNVVMAAMTTLATVALLLALRDPAALPARLLGTRPAAWLGERSYVVYLVHVPVRDAFGPRLDGVPPAARFAVVLAVCTVLAAVSFRYVEQPVRAAVARRQTSESSIRVLPSVFGLTRARSRNSATPSSMERSSSA